MVCCRGNWGGVGLVQVSIRVRRDVAGSTNGGGED